MIAIGNQTSFSTAPLEPFEYAVANGFDAFEWFPDKQADAGWAASDLDTAQRRAIRETAAASGLRLSVHARWQANPLQPESQSMLLEDLQLARDVEARVFNIHLVNDGGLDAFVAAIQPLLSQAKTAGLQLSIENTPEHTPELFNELFERLGRVDSVRGCLVGMCLDIGHANLCAATRNDYLGFVDRLKPHVPIVHLHAHENWGDSDSHLPLFTGPAARDEAGVRGLVKRLRQRDYAGSIIFEQWPQPPSLLNNARERLVCLLEKSGIAVGQRVAPPPGERAGEARRAEPRAALIAGDSRLTGDSLTTVGLPPAPAETAPARVAGRPADTSLSAQDSIATLVAADQRSRSWREKLESVRRLLVEQSAPPSDEQLADIAIYLRFLGTGEIACTEDGRHFRPAHHARIAGEIYGKLAGLSTPDAPWLTRKIYPWLPSAAPEFRSAEPLTRIRDIAHRNDIPSELKREIKTTLQNKLHRCAGPEDLVTSAALLERITAPGADYAPAFVEQFKLFHEELKEFFNATSLDERLNGLLPAADKAQASLIRSFLNQKNANGLTGQLATLKALTDLRQALLQVVEKNSRPELPEFLQADIALEDFAFALLSELLNALEAPAPLPGRAAAEFWPGALALLHLTLCNLALSSVAAEESRALAAEARAWQRGFVPDRLPLLRLKATAERSRRLAEDYSERVLALFVERARRLGRALGVAEHSVRVFGEGEVRRHLVFQLSKLASSLLRRIREALALPAWDVIVAGRAAGRLKVAGSLAEISRELPEPVVALVNHAEGDEELPAGITGVMLAHEVPHLSHLGVRARQAGVVFVAGDEAAALEPVRALEGRLVSLSATSQAVECVPTIDLDAGRAPSAPQVPPPVVKRQDTPARLWLELEQVAPDSAGHKADGARRLAELAAQPGAGFQTPGALAIPFGVMEAAFRAVPKLALAYQGELAYLDKLAPEELVERAARLRELIQQLSVPDDLLAAVAEHFGPGQRLMVRSSSNCEDLPDLAGAGLYESVGNVAPRDVAAAVRTVWASLWTRRAAVSRRQAGIPQAQAQMAVLIQQMLEPEYSFVLHTLNPVNQSPDELYAELAVGLGETLVSAAARGNPYRLVCGRKSGSVTPLAFASFSRALQPDPGGGVASRVVDYSQVELSRDPGALSRLGVRLASIGRVVERAFQEPQDIEGAVVNNALYLLQSRPQQGLAQTPHPTHSPI